jgi:hypothetical protein
MLVNRAEVDDPLIKEDDPLLTRKGVHEYINIDLELPMSFPWLEKLALDGKGPPIECYWGKYPMSRRSRVREWAEKRMRRVAPDEHHAGEPTTNAMDKHLLSAEELKKAGADAAWDMGSNRGDLEENAAMTGARGCKVRNRTGPRPEQRQAKRRAVSIASQRPVAPD